MSRRVQTAIRYKRPDRVIREPPSSSRRNCRKLQAKRKVTAAVSMPDQDQKTSEGLVARKQAGTAASIAEHRESRVHATRYSRRTVARPKRPDECVVDDARLERPAQQREGRDQGQQERPSSKPGAALASLDLSPKKIEHDAETLSAKAAGV